MGGFIADMNQDQKILILEKKVRRLENKLNGGNGMSKIFETLIGQDVTLNISYEELKCRVLDCDEEWIKLLVYGKKKDITVIRPIYEITKVTLDKDGI
ncbi:MAG: hypothetical protein K6F71_00475 [Ruminococcus sp.]|uniref:hypothetical protein n=1 Tax=Ruminococcus sp. TaxID=41978 RepID=UPI0025E3CD5F|nr:hypothetical protein [Ruminococcus sp.]MCR5539298.1 hypothetical protein [Ruminococcus sp.]